MRLAAAILSILAYVSTHAIVSSQKESAKSRTELDQASDYKKVLGSLQTSCLHQQSAVAIAVRSISLRPTHDDQRIAKTVEGGLSKREILSRRIRVRIIHDCPTTGRRHEDFEWTVSWDSVTQTVHYLPVTHIDDFPRESTTFDDSNYPATFGGSWTHDSWKDCDKLFERHYCRHSYRGFFQGWLSWQGIEVGFIDHDPLGWRSPVIIEHCTGKRVAVKSCTKWTVSLHCHFVQSIVTFPYRRPS